MHFHFKSALVTGGAGFIGSHVAEALAGAGCRVTVLDNMATGNPNNLGGVGERLNLVEGDIRDGQILEKAIKGCEVVFHQAAVVSVAQSVEDPLGSALVNDIGTLSVLEAARRAGVQRVVLASSAAVYGDASEVPNRENMIPVPMSPYAVQKLTNELYARTYYELYGLETVCLRYFNVFGPRQDPSSPYSGVISIFMARSAARERPVIFGDGEQYRDFVYVKDIVRANLLAAATPGIGGMRFNIGVGTRVTVNHLWQLVSDLAGFAVTPDYQPARSGDIRESLASIQAAGEVLGYRPAYPFEASLAETFAWYLDKRSVDRFPKSGGGEK